MSKKSKWSLIGLGLVLPSFLALFLLVIIPVYYSIVQSVQDSDGNFTWDHYIYLFTNPAMIQNIIHTLYITIVSSFIVLLISYVLAIYMRFGKSWMANFIRKIYFLPIFIPGIIAIYGFINMYRDNGWIARIIGEGILPQIIYDAKGVILMNLWFNIPFTTMLLSSALAAIPTSVIESARDAGAGKLALFTRFILPMSLKTMLVALTFLFMGIVGSFTNPFLIDRNAPQMLGVAMQQHFSVYNELGQASSMSIFMFLLSATMGYFYIRSMMKENMKSL
ncbi:ABC transporter permease subunit [Bacillaceae bacterium Marseille-Q3522]|nr:ABC transporter permease subunit [Bacillaceae bacterium Marseille-Q3522]